MTGNCLIKAATAQQEVPSFKRTSPKAPHHFCPRLISPWLNFFACRDLVLNSKAIFAFLCTGRNVWKLPICPSANVIGSAYSFTRFVIGLAHFHILLRWFCMDSTVINMNMTTLKVIDNPQWRPQWGNFNFLPQCLDNFSPINRENAVLLMCRGTRACFPPDLGAGRNEMKYCDSAVLNKNYSNQCGGTIIIIEGLGKGTEATEHPAHPKHVLCFNSLFADICSQFSFSGME